MFIWNRNRCSTSQFGNKVVTNYTIEGVLRFDRHSLSITSQLSSCEISRKIFSHCSKVKSVNAGGGILVLDNIRNPSMVYTPLVLSMYVKIESKLFILSTLSGAITM